jgi:hypothetical protein
MNVLNTNAASNTPVDASYLFMDLFFDVVSDLMFGQSFDSLTLRERSPITREFVARQKAVGFVIMNMWVFHLIRAIRQLASHVMYWVQWCVSSPRERKELRERHVFRTRQWYIDALEERAKVSQNLRSLSYADAVRCKRFRPTYSHTSRCPIHLTSMAFMRLN